MRWDVYGLYPVLQLNVPAPAASLLRSKTAGVSVKLLFQVI